VLKTELTRGGKKVPAFLIADAYDGRRIKEATQQFFELASGRGSEEISIGVHRVKAGGASHVVVYVGHDGLMEFDIPTPKTPAADAPARSAVVLACSSRDYFGPLLTRTGAHRLLMTTGFMAPEAYTLDAAIRNWFEGESSHEVRQAAATAYDRFQHCGMRGALRLFATDP